MDAPVNGIVFLIPFLVSIKAVTFSITYNTQIFQSTNTIDVHSESIVSCAKLCSYQDKCCVAGFEKLTSSCRMDTSENCSISTHTDSDSDVMHRQLYDALYFLGGYKFNAYDGIRWINTPGQAMTFTDYAANEPNNPTTELCIGSYRHMQFQWVDIPCNWLKSYICEFQE
ncbi:unnamed protein product [Mytilus edulis]|uniref:C-type lectin domain-containing protein n=1 Tax=Mytilus edulis TaxID=6550 RepID=A0A8S3UWM3_MYTED|nr:unnamed protein product [Mytilus edulis]